MSRWSSLRGSTSRLLACVSAVVVAVLIISLFVISSARESRYIDLSQSSTLSGADAYRLAESANSQPFVTPSMVGAFDEEEIVSTIVELNFVPTGSDEARAIQVAEFVDELVADLPPGSVMASEQVSTVPVVSLRISKSAFEELVQLSVVKVVSLDSFDKRPSEAQKKPATGDSGRLVPSSSASTSTMGATTAWSAGWKGAGTVIAVLDTGVESSHPYLARNGASKVIGEGCFADSGGAWSSTCPGGQPMNTTDAPRAGAGAPCPVTLAGCSHGTHVAGIAAGGTGGSIPSGVAPDASIVSVQVFSRNGSSIGSSDSAINNGLQWLYTNRSRFPGLVAVNLSLGGSSEYLGYCDWDPTKAYIDQLLSVGISTVVASGNDGWADAVSSPACISSAVTVGSVDGTPDQTAPYSNDGPQVDLMAPGTSINSSVPGGRMELKSGTSMATPAIAGSIALLRQDQPATTVARLRETGYTVNASGFLIPSVRLGNAIVGYPGPVRSVSVTSSAGSANVRWVAPSSSGSSSDLSYSVVAIPGGATCQTGWNLECSVTGLVAGSTYVFAVKARTSTGFGPGVISPATTIADAVAPPPGTPTNAFFPATPGRVYDSRKNLPRPGRLASGESRVVSVADRRDLNTGQVDFAGLVPPGARAVSINLTVTETAGEGWLAVNAGGDGTPYAAAINWYTNGMTIGNGIIVPLNGNRELTVIAGGPGSTNFIIDVTGYWD